MEWYEDMIPDADSLLRRAGKYSSYSPVEHIQCWAGFFVVCLAAKLVGPLFPRFGMPYMTGYLLTGAACGPYILGLVSKEDALSLQHINSFALAYICTSAGAEMHLPMLRPIFKSILTQMGLLEATTFVVIVMAAKGLSTTSLSEFSTQMTDNQQWAVALCMATIACSRSPSAAVAVVRELLAKGKTTTSFMGITVLCDVLVLIIFPIVVAYSKAQFSDNPFQPKVLGLAISMIFASMISGVFLGGVYAAIMRVEHLAFRCLMFPAGYLVFLGCSYFAKAMAREIEDESNGIALEPLLLCITGGFVTVNYSKFHFRFIDALKQGSPYIMLPFFTLVGAKLDLLTFVKALPLAIILSILRALCVFAGSSLGGYLVGQEKKMYLTIWMCLVSQAGFDLGLAAEIGNQFPGWGKKFEAVIISCVVVNQLIGPVLCKTALKWSGEVGKASGTEVIDEAENDPNALHVADMNKAVIIGVTPQSKAIAFALLKKRWGVAMLTSTVEEATMLDEQVSDWAEKFRAEYFMRHQDSLRDGTVWEAAPVLHHENNFKAVPFTLPELITGHPLSEVVDGDRTAQVVGSGFGAAVGAAPVDGPSPVSAVRAPNVSVELSLTTQAVVEANSQMEVRVDNQTEHSSHGVTFSNTESRSSVDKEKEDKILARGTSLDMLLPRSVLQGNMTPVGLHEVLDNTDALQTVVVALDTDAAGISLLKTMLCRWGPTKSTKIRVLVMIEDPASAQQVADLGAVAVQSFVSTHTHAILAAVTPYEKDAILVPGTTTQSAWSAAYLELHDPALRMSMV